MSRPSAGWTRLSELRLGFNQISDLTPVCGLDNLSYLDVHNNRVSDISCLTGFTSLSRLDLRNNPLSASAYDTYIPQIQANNPGIYIEHDSHAGRILTTSSTAGGSVIDPGEGQFTYDYDAYVRVEAKADPGFTFAGWSGNYASSQNPLFINLTADGYIQATFVSMLTELYVDDDAPGDPAPGDARAGDPHEDGTFEHPFDRIQEAIDVASPGASVIVRPGAYRENISLRGKKIYVTAVDPKNPYGGPCATIEGVGNGPVVSIPPGGSNKCSLVGFVITKGAGQTAGAVHCTSSSPTLSNCLIVGNRCPYSEGSIAYFYDSRAVLTNCTIADNFAGEDGTGLVPDRQRYHDDRFDRLGQRPPGDRQARRQQASHSVLRRPRLVAGPGQHPLGSPVREARHMGEPQQSQRSARRRRTHERRGLAGIIT